jgi:chromosomal replication initiator protein
MTEQEIYENVKAEKLQAVKDSRICDDIVLLIQFHFEVKLSDLTNCTRRHEIVIPRQLAMHFMSKYTRIPYWLIGGRFGKDHATVSNSNKVVADLIFSDKRYRYQYRALDAEIKEYIKC